MMNPISQSPSKSNPRRKQDGPQSSWAMKALITVLAGDALVRGQCAPGRRLLQNPLAPAPTPADAFGDAPCPRMLAPAPDDDGLGEGPSAGMLAPTQAPEGAMAPAFGPDGGLPGLPPALAPSVFETPFAPSNAPDAAPSAPSSSNVTAACGQGVLTQRYNNGRTGWTPCETQLTPHNVNSTNFGKIGSFAVDGQIFAQPLYLPEVSLPAGVTRDLLIVATMQNTVFAFDANKPASLPLWQTNLGTPGSPHDIGIDAADGFGPALGILSTPVKDPNSNFVYVVSFNGLPSASGTVYTHHLHAIDVRNGAENIAVQTRIAGSVRGTAPDAKNGILSFNSVDHLQRPALTLTDGSLIVQFGSHDNVVPTHGWEFIYDAQSLSLQTLYCASPNDYGNSFWNGGTGAAVATNGVIFTSTATGFPNSFIPNIKAPHNNASNPTDRSDSVLKQRLVNGVLTLEDYYTPNNWDTLTLTDKDFGSAGVMVPPTGTRVFATDKTGVLYNVPRTNMGHVVPANDTSTQKVKVGNGPLYGTPVYFAGQGETQVFAWSDAQSINGYRFRNNRLDIAPNLKINLTDVPATAAGGMLSLSSNGNDRDSALLWGVLFGTPKDGRTASDAVLHAVDVRNNRLAWSSATHESRDGVGSMAKFIAPVVAEGKVYVANQDNGVHVYGLRS